MFVLLCIIHGPFGTLNTFKYSELIYGHIQLQHPFNFLIVHGCLLVMKNNFYLFSWMTTYNNQNSIRVRKGSHSLFTLGSCCFQSHGTIFFTASYSTGNSAMCSSTLSLCRPSSFSVLMATELELTLWAPKGPNPVNQSHYGRVE